MLKFMTATEYCPKGTLKNNKLAKQFYCDKDRILHLYSLRTTLSINHFKRVFFAPAGDGAYLEKCCGKGKVQLNPTKGPFFALQGLLGQVIERKLLQEQFEHIEETVAWDRDIYKPTMLFSTEEIEKYAMNPFKTIMVRNFGEVNPENIEKFKAAVNEFFSSQTPREHDIFIA